MAWTVNLVNTSLNALVTTAIADNSFSYDDVLKLLNTVTVGGLTPSELGDLKTVYTNTTGIFSSDYVKSITYNVIYGNPANNFWWGGQSAIADVDQQGNLSGSTTEFDAKRLVSEWFLGADLPIAVAGGDTATGKASKSSFSYSLATGSLYVNGVDDTDVNQGSAGTCYFLASIGAIANAKPSYITDAFTDNGNGTYGVRLFINGVAMYTTVNASLPTKSGSLPFAANVAHSSSGELWVALLEKAYAQLNAQANIQGEPAWNGESSYQAIEGGLAYPIKQITGLNYRYYTKQNWNAIDGFEAGVVHVQTSLELKLAMINALNAGSIGWLGTVYQGAGVVNDPINGLKNLVAGHAYMLIGYNSATDKFIVRNPWGGDGNPNNGYNPQFELTAEVIWQNTLVALTDVAIADPVYSYSVTSNAASANTAVSEGGTITFTIGRSGGDLAFASTVYVSTSEGSANNSDFQALGRTAITFAANQTSKTVTVKSIADVLTEGTEVFSMNIYKQSSDSVSIATAEANIKDVPVKSYSYAIASSTFDATAAVREGGTIEFTITRSADGAGSDTASTVYVSTAGISANGRDFSEYTKLAVTFAAYDTSKTVSIKTTQDNEAEGTESFSLDLYRNIGDGNKTTSSVGYIKDEYLPNYSYAITSSAGSSSSAAYEGSKVSFTITRSGTGASSTVFISTENGSAGSSDYLGFSKKAVTFAANQNVAVVTVDVMNDTWLEAVEYFKLTLYKLLSDSTYSSSAAAFITEPVALVNEYSYSISSSAASNPTAVTEGGTITFTITRSASGSASTVYLSTADATTSSSDYQGISKSALSFAANETVKTVTIKTNTDTLTESVEYFELKLFKNQVDNIAVLSAPAFIKDPAAAVSYNYTITNPASSVATAAAEGSPITFTITRSSSGTESTVYVSSAAGTASAGAGDYLAPGVTAIIFAANQTSKTITISTYSDSLAEGSEYFFLNLYKTQADADASNYATYSTAYLKDPVAVVDYSYSVTSSAASSSTAATEGGLITFTITRSASGSASTVYLSTENADTVDGDYQGVDKLAMNFAANETVKTITVATNTDSQTEGSEYFWLNVYKSYTDALNNNWSSYSSAFIKDPAAAVSYNYTITNPASSVATAAAEGSPITFTITRSSSGTESTVYVSSAAGTASAGAGDYLAPGVTAIIFAANQTSKTITISTYSDSLAEGSEYFFLNLYKTQADADASNYATYSTAYLKDPVAVVDYSYSVTSSAASSSTAATEGGLITFTITRSASGSASTVYLSTENADTVDGDYQGVDKLAMNFAANETVKTITVATNTDSQTEGSEYFWLNVYKSYTDALNNNWSSYSSAFIKDPAAAVSYNYTITNPASSVATAAAEGSPITFTITRSSSGTESTVYVSSAAGTASAGAGDYLAPGVTAIIFAANQTSKTITISTYSDSLAEGSEYFFLNLYKTQADADASNYATYSTAYLKDPVAVVDYSYSVTSSAASSSTAATEGGLITFTITRSASGSASTVYLSTENADTVDGDYQGVDKLAMNFAANETVKTITVATNTDSQTEGSEYFWLNVYKSYTDALNNNWSSYSSAFIKDPAAAVSYNYTITNPASSVATAAAEGSPITFTITRSSSGTESTVYVSSAAGTASAGAGDYLAPGVTAIIFAANQTSKTITISTYSDSLAEGSEYFFLNLYKTQADADASNYATYSTAYLKDPVAVVDYSYSVTSSAASSSTAATEGGLITFTITRSASGSASTVYLSTENADTVDGDYQGVDKLAMNFAANETVKTITVATNTDSQTEGSEYFWLNVYKSYTDALNNNWSSYSSAFIKDPAAAVSYNYTITNPASSVATAAAEGSPITFTITRSSSGTESTVYVSSAAGTASAGAGDYLAPGVTAIIFAANQTSKTITISTYSDSLAEGSEYFFLNLYKTQADADASNYATYSTAYLKDPVAVVDYSYSVTSSAASSSTAATEGGLITFTITRSASGSASTVYLSTENADTVDGDYQGVDKLAMNFAANETVKTITVATNTDSQTEGSEYFWLNVYKSYTDALNNNWSSYSSAFIKDPAAAVSYNYTITNPASSVATAAAEGSPITFTITRSSSGTESTVYVSSAAGTASAGAGDYLAPGVTAIIFAANQTSKTITISTYSDSLAEGSEYFFLNLYKTQADADASNYATYSTAYLKDPVAVVDYSYSVTSSAASSSTAATEGGLITFTITRSASGSASTVYLSTENADTVDGDYQGVDKLAMNFAANETVKTITVATNTDSQTEGSEYFWLNVYKSYTDALNNNWSSYSSAFIKDPAAAVSYNYTITNPASSVATAAAEGSPITFTITRSSSGTESTVYVSSAAGTASAGAGDYLAPGVTAIIFAANQTSKTITISTYSDSLAEGSEYFFLNLYKTQADADASNYATYSTAYLKDPVAVVDYSYSVTSSAASSSTAATEGGLITFTITRSASGSASTVYLSTENADTVDGDYQGVDKLAMNFAANETVKTITVATNTDSQTEGSEYFWLNVYKSYTDALNNNWSSYSSAFIKDPAAAVSYNYTITNPASSVATAAAEGSPITFTITRSSSGTESTVYVSSAAGTASAGAGDYLAPGVTAIIFAANQTSKTITISTYSDSLAEGSEYFFLNLYKTQADADASNYATYSTAYLKDPVAVVDYSYSVTSSAASSSTAATEGGLITFTITRSASGSASTVYLSTENADTVDGDYQGVDKLAMNFAANETVKTITVATNTDSQTEGSEYFWLNVYKSYTDALNNNWSSYSSAFIKDPAAAVSYNYTITNPASSVATAAAEGSPITFTITRSSSGTESTVYVGASDGTATYSGGDYLATGLITIIFAANQTIRTVTVETYTDTLTEGSEYFFLPLYKTLADLNSNTYASYGTAYLRDPLVIVSGVTAEPIAVTTASTSLGVSVALQSSVTPSTSPFPGHTLGEFKNSYSFAAIKANGGVVTWGYAANGGDSSAVAGKLNGDIDVGKVYSSDSAFAALRVDGSVVTWGNANTGGNSSAVSLALSGAIKTSQVYSTQSAFAALREDGSVITWGDSSAGADSSSVTAQLNGNIDVSRIFSTMSAFAALRVDGSLVTWGYGPFGGDSSAVASQLTGAIDVVKVFSTGSAFAALRVNGSLVSWGSPMDGGDSSAVANKINGAIPVVSVAATTSAFAAIRQDGSVVTWGDTNNGGNSDAVAQSLNGGIGVAKIVSSNSAFAALRADGSVVAWGNTITGGDSGQLFSSLSGTKGVIDIYANSSAFAALCIDGSVVTWGNGADGGDSSGVKAALDGAVDVKSIVATDHAFAALRSDGSVVTWGGFLGGGDSEAVAASLNGTMDVISISASAEAFSALRMDGTVVVWGESGRGGDSGSVASQLTSVTSLSNVLTTYVPGQNLTGTSAAESYTSTAGNDTIDGGAGIDTVNYHSPRAGYLVTKTAGGQSVSDNTVGAGSTDGVDSLKNVETLRFTDMSVDLTMAQKATTISAADLKTLQELYVGFFNRVPEAAGLAYWIGEHARGVSLNAIADQFYGAGVQFNLYSASMTNDQFITTVYANVLGRTGPTAPPQSDINYWANRLVGGQDTKGTMVLTMLHDSHAFFTGDPTYGWVVNLLDNKATVANYFAIEQGLSYNVQQDNITKGIEIAAQITPTDTAQAIALIGITGGPVG